MLHFIMLRGLTLPALLLRNRAVQQDIDDDMLTSYRDLRCMNGVEVTANYSLGRAMHFHTVDYGAIVTLKWQ